MFRKILASVLLLVIMTYSIGCYTQTFVVGKGAQGTQTIEEKQWYILWGLVPLNQVDNQKMAGGAENYTIMTQQSFIDIIIGMFTGVVTVYPRTVQVTK